MPDHATFNEGQYPATPATVEAYRRAMARGFDRMKGHDVVIAGLARNVASILPKTIARARYTARLFRSCKFVIYENDSTDNTKLILDSWANKDSNATILSEKRGEPVNRQVRCLDRATRMAHYRNCYRQYIADRLKADYIIVVDTDLLGGWSYEGIANTFGQSLAWDMVGSNGRKLHNGKDIYFDAWAFRRQGSYKPILSPDVNRTRWRRGEPMVPVSSCFGGLGIYRFAAFQRCAYTGADCEHVPLHRCMAENGMGRIFMNPSQLAIY